MISFLCSPKAGAGFPLNISLPSNLVGYLKARTLPCEALFINWKRLFASIWGWVINSSKEIVLEQGTSSFCNFWRASSTVKDSKIVKFLINKYKNNKTRRQL